MQKNIQILRCDITTTLTNYIDFILISLANPAGTEKIDKNTSIISGGYIGKKRYDYNASLSKSILGI